MPLENFLKKNNYHGKNVVANSAPASSSAYLLFCSLSHASVSLLISLLPFLCYMSTLLLIELKD